MANNDRLNNAIDNVIDALTELKEAWKEAQDSYTPKVIISDEPPVPPASEQAPIPIPVPPAQAITPPVQMSASTDNIQMQVMFCDNCGTKLRPGARFCSNCGNPA